MSKIPAINEIDANSPSQESTEVVVKATTVTPDINEIQETISASATIQEIDGTRKPTISEIYKIVNDGLFESTTNWWDYAYKLSQAQLNQDIISRLDNGVIGGGYSKGVDIITTTSNKVPSNTNVYSALKSDSLYPKKLNDEVINGIYDFLNGITIGKPTAYTGGTWSVDKVGKTHLTTDYLYVRLKAIFETLQILNVDTIGGKLVISPAGSIRIAYVDRIKIDAPVFEHDEKTDVWSISQVEDAEGNLVNETLNQEVYRCYFLGEQDGEAVENKWKIGDQAQAKTFNVKKGAYHKVENSYFWRLVVNVSTDTVDIDGKKYHYVDLSQIDFDSGSDAPAPGDVLNQLGHRLNDTQRQTALVLNAVDNYAPSITLYAGINYYTYLNKEYVEFGVYNGKAFFNVYGDMYIGDKGINPTTYIKYKNGKLNIKANLEIGSSIGDKDLDEYIKENGGVDEETVKKLINNSQVIKDLQKQTDGAIETWFYEGEPTLKNLPAIDWTTEDLKKIHIGDLYYDQTTGYAYRFTKYNDDVIPYRWNRIKDNDIVAALDAANRAQATADGKMKVFYGEIKPTNYQVGDIWVNATLAGKFNNDIARAIADNKTSFNADDWVLASRYSEAIATIQKWTNEYETKFSNLVNEVKQQKDQSIVVWYYDYEPTVDNIPANTWNTNDLRSEHIGDIFYDIKNNHSYRWTGSAWSMIKDADFDEAMKKAKDAEDLADKKRQIFYSDTTPTGGDRGDLWVKQVGNKTEVWVFDGTNWVKSNDKALADYTEAINKELEGIKGQLDGKAETWYQPTDPSTNWTNKTSHEGDIWYNTTNGTTQYWNGTAWEKMDIPKDVFDTIDGKSSIFVDSYDDAKAGRGTINKGYKERDLWILPEDATVNGTAYYKGDILTATVDGTTFNEKHWIKKVRYVGESELIDAIDNVNKKIENITASTLPGLNDKFNDFTKDGVLNSSEKARLTDDLNQMTTEIVAVNDQITSVTSSTYLEGNDNKGKLTEAQKTLNIAWTEYKNYVTALIDGITAISKVSIAQANSVYRSLQNALASVKQYIILCQGDLLSAIGNDIASYRYLKNAMTYGKTTVTGGLILSSAIELKDIKTDGTIGDVTAGINGVTNGLKSSIASWYGGPMVDRATVDGTADTWESGSFTTTPGTDYAMSLFRHDGSGYLAGGKIWWEADSGNLHVTPNSFVLEGQDVALYILLFKLNFNGLISWANMISATPQKPFTNLKVLSTKTANGITIGDSTSGGRIVIGNIILSNNGKSDVLEITNTATGKIANVGVSGGISAYGTYTPSTGGGGGLSGTIIPYSTAIASDPQNEGTKIASASSIYKLHSRISSIENNGATSITVIGTGNAITSVVKNGTSITFAKGATFLTAHQSLANYYTKSSVDSLLSNKSDISHTHKVKINGDIKTITSNEDPIVNLGNYITSHQSLAAYATQNWVKNEATAHNADMVDNYHANGLLTAISNSDKGVSITVGGTTKSVSNISVNYASNAGNADTVDGYHATDGRTFNGSIHWSGNWNDSWSDGTNSHPWYGFDHRYKNTGPYSTTITDYFGMTIKTANTLRLDFRTLLLNGTNIYNSNVASATKLQTARTIWGQSFDGTGNVNGTIYINNTNSTNGAIILNNNVNTHARISAIDDNVIFNTSAAIRFGETAWDWNQWAGLKYNHPTKTIYLGIADGAVFNANSPQGNGTLRLISIKTVTPDSGARIGGSGGNLYLGNANNSGWVCVQDMTSQDDSNNWRIYQNGTAIFKGLTLNGTTTFNNLVKVNNMLTAKAIMFTTADVNAFGTDINNWDGSIGANVTNMFNGIPQENIQVEYSLNNGASWNKYSSNSEQRFNLVNDNVGTFNYYLGSNNMDGDTNADKLTQIKKNQLRVTVKIPAEIYQELSWISVDVNNGVNIKCQVYFGNSNGVYTEYVSKVMKGWAHKCDICVGPNNVNVGNDMYRYVRLVFSHLNNNTDLRNGIVAKIRALALTKYSYNSDRYTIGVTGHIYDYDYNMNTYFPNSILAKGGVTAYQSSDVRLKTNITKLNCLNVIKSIGGTYEFDYIRDHKHSIGFIAQNVNNPLLKDIIAKDKDGYLKINYWSPKLISLAFGALTEIDDEVDKLKARVRELETEVEYLKNRDYALQ